MGKRGKSSTQKLGSSKKSKLRKIEDVDVNDIDDEIDAFNKKRDVVPLDVNADSGDSDEDDQQDVFNYEGIDGSEDDDEDDDEFEDDEDNLDQYYDKGLAAKIIKQQKYLREKTGGADDDFVEDTEENETTIWPRGKNVYHGGEVLSSDEEAEEEEEVIRLQKERAESLRAEDFGLQIDEDLSDVEPTLEEMMGKERKLSSEDKKAGGDGVVMLEEVKKDLAALSKDEQMDIVYNSAPELVGLLSELNDAVNELETHITPLLCKVRTGKNAKKEGMHYLEVKQLLLQAYCQAIVFYLLLKSEGQLVRDHPVIGRLVELKTLLDKTKELDQFIPDKFEDDLNDADDAQDALKPAARTAASSSSLYTELSKLTGLAAETKDAPQPAGVKEEKQRKRKLENVSSESVKMLQYRAALEDKLKHKSVADSDASRAIGSMKKKLKTLSGNLETADDFDDDAMEVGGTTQNNGRASTLSSKLSRIIPAKNKKGVSGDDDLPERDNLGERRWKHELRVLERAGIKSKNDDDQPENGPESSGDDVVGDDDEDDGADEDGVGSGEDFYSTIKRQRDLKLQMKAAKYSRNPQDEYIPVETVDGKRYISTQIEKNRGLTRNRKKLFKNPRKKRRVKYEDAVKRRKGQVRQVRTPSFSYGGETTGINARVTRSIKL